MYSITVRNNILIAHSLPGEVFGPAQNMHGATYIVDAEFYAQEVNKYIKAHNLQNPENKKKIKPDKTLCGLLNIDSANDDLTYFSMQKYLKDHFPKDDTTVVV